MDIFMMVQSVKRALDALDILVFNDIYHEGIGLFEMAKRLELQPNTLHNLLKTMIACGYVAQNESGKYISGSKVEECELLNRLSSQKNLEEVLRPVLSRLSNKIDEMTVFAVLSNGNRLPLITVEHDNPIKVDTSLIENEHIYEKPTGRILTAYSNDNGFEAIKQRWGYPGNIWDDINNDASFIKAIGKIRSVGSSVIYTEDNQIVGLAVPVFGLNEKLLGSLGSYAPVYRCDEKKQKKLLEELKKTADELSQVID